MVREVATEVDPTLAATRRTSLHPGVVAVEAMVHMQHYLGIDILAGAEAEPTRVSQMTKNIFLHPDVVVAAALSAVRRQCRVVTEAVTEV